MKKFSLVTPTRSRPQLLKDLLLSIQEKTENKNDIEVIIAYDFDDKVTESMVGGLEAKYKDINLHFIGRTRSIYTTNDYYNWLALHHSSGEFVVFINDDTLFETKSWDVLTYKKLQDYLQDKPDGVVYGITEDMEYAPRRDANNYFSCFPLMSRKAITALGFAFDPEFHRDGADWAIISVYKELERILDLRHELVIKHLSYRSKRREWDEVDEEAKRLSLILVYPHTHAFLTRDVGKLREYIENYNRRKNG